MNIPDGTYDVLGTEIKICDCVGQVGLAYLSDSSAARLLRLGYLESQTFYRPTAKLERYIEATTDGPIKACESVLERLILAGLDDESQQILIDAIRAAKGGAQ